MSAIEHKSSICMRMQHASRNIFAYLRLDAWKMHRYMVNEPAGGPVIETSCSLKVARKKSARPKKDVNPGYRNRTSDNLIHASLYYYFYSQTLYQRPKQARAPREGRGSFAF